jgi:hypothetical protein
MLQLQKDVHKMLGEIFMELNLLTPQHVINALGFQLEENIFRVVEWGNGKFVFDEMAPHAMTQPTFYPFKDIDLNNFLTQFREKSKEFKNLGAQLPSDSSKMSLFVPMNELGPDVKENPEIMEILHYCDGSKTVGEIRKLTSGGLLKAQRLLFSLYLKDIIKVVSAGGTISQKKVYESFTDEVEGVRELFKRIFPPILEEIAMSFKQKMGPKSRKIIAKIVKEISSTYPELCDSDELDNFDDLDIDEIFNRVNIHTDASWYHNIFSLLTQILFKSLSTMSGILGKVQVEKIVEQIEERVDLNLDEDKTLAKKYNMRQDFDRVIASLK